MSVINKIIRAGLSIIEEAAAAVSGNSFDFQDGISFDFQDGTSFDFN
jgi:hypothetical protein